MMPGESQSLGSAKVFMQTKVPPPALPCCLIPHHPNVLLDCCSTFFSPKGHLRLDAYKLYKVVVIYFSTDLHALTTSGCRSEAQRVHDL